MAHYDYRCAECGKKFEAVQTFEEHDRREDHERHKRLTCPKCGSRRVEQRIGSPAFAITTKKS